MHAKPGIRLEMTEEPILWDEGEASFSYSYSVPGAKVLRDNE